MVASGVVGVVGAVYAVSLFLVRELSFMSGDQKKARLNASSVDATIPAIFVTFFTILIPSVLVLFPQIFGVLRPLGFPSFLMFSAFYLGEGQGVIGFVFVMMALLLCLMLAKKWEVGKARWLALAVGAMILVDSLSLISFFLWILVLLLAAVVRPTIASGGLVKLFARLLVVTLLGVLMTSLWFTPGFFFTVLRAPSLGGRPFAVVVAGLFRQFFVVIPAILGVVAARKWFRTASPLTVIGIMGLLVYGSLTVAAFTADPDFWQDYSRFGRSLDLAVGMSLTGLIWDRNMGRTLRLWVFAGMLVLGLPFFFKRGIMISEGVAFPETAEYRVGEALSRFMDDDCREVGNCSLRAYVSGSSAFWLNSWFDVAQVRGGGEQGSLNPWWPHGSYQIREGRDAELADLWLKVLGVSYLVVHGEESLEVYHDFRYPSKFDGMEGWEKVWERAGDMIYRRQKRGLAEVADLGILSVLPPEKGDDASGLLGYVEKLGEPAVVRFTGEREVDIAAQVNEGQGVRLAVASSPFWRVGETSMPVSLVRDPMGMIVLRPVRSGILTIKLRYEPWLDVISGIVVSVVALLFVLFRPQFSQRVSLFIERLGGRESELDRSAF